MNINEKLKAILPKSVMIYLDPKEGLSSSEANHIANMIKEIARKYSSEAERSFSATEKVEIDGSEKILKKGFVAPEECFVKPGQLFGLSAWLRSAIKAKEEAGDLLNSFEESKFDLESNEPKWELKAPELVKVEYIKSYDIDNLDPADFLDIAELAEYYSLEAQASGLGKYLHKNCILDNLRESILSFSTIDIRSIGQKEYLVERTPVCSEEEISALYFSLQKQHRDAESKLNYYKSKIKNSASMHNMDLNKAYTQAINKAKAEYDVLRADYDTKFETFSEQYKVWRNEMELERIELSKYLSAHKIIIPHSLKPILDEVKTILG